MANSALEVVLGGFPFTALGHETETRWTAVYGIPAVEAVWWAGGLRVTERIYALTGVNTFMREVTLTSANLAGPEQVTLRLSLPPGVCTTEGGAVPAGPFVPADAGGCREGHKRNDSRRAFGGRSFDACTRRFQVGRHHAVGGSFAAREKGWRERDRRNGRSQCFRR